MNVGNTISDLCGVSIRAVYMGGDYVLFHPVGQKVIHSKELIGFLEWFDYIRPWSVRDVNNNRVVWTRWYGVPLQAWNEKFFNLVAIKFGKPLRIVADISKLKSVQFARVLIHTPYPKIPEALFPVEVDGYTHHIRVSEEDLETGNSSEDDAGTIESEVEEDEITPSESFSEVPESPEMMKEVDGGGVRTHVVSAFENCGTPKIRHESREMLSCKSNYAGDSRMVGLYNRVAKRKSDPSSVIPKMFLRKNNLGPPCEMGQAEKNKSGLILESSVEYPRLYEFYNPTQKEDTSTQEKDQKRGTFSNPTNSQKMKSLIPSKDFSESMNTEADSQEISVGISANSSPK